jgi:hypothetical protein
VGVVAISADRWSDDVRLSDIEPRFVCQACFRRGADEQTSMGIDLRLSSPDFYECDHKRCHQNKNDNNAKRLQGVHTGGSLCE